MPLLLNSSIADRLFCLYEAYTTGAFAFKLISNWAS